MAKAFQKIYTEITAITKAYPDITLFTFFWLDQNYDELNKFGKTSFRQDHFIETIPFQELEIEIIEMDDTK